MSSFGKLRKMQFCFCWDMLILFLDQIRNNLHHPEHDGTNKFVPSSSSSTNAS